MKKALLAGATGLIGKHCLDLLLKESYYDEIEIWVRKTTGITHPKLKEKIIDFSQISNTQNFNTLHVYCCLGTTIKKAKSKEAFREVDYTYVVELAKLAERSKSEKFLVVSSIGANSKSGNFYLRTKGEMEQSVLSCKIPGINIFRPSLLLGNRGEFRLGEKIGVIFMKFVGIFLIGKLKKYRGIEASTVANAMLKTAQESKTGGFIIESDEIQKIGGN